MLLNEGLYLVKSLKYGIQKQGPNFGILWKRYNIVENKIPGIDIVLDDLEKELGYRQEQKTAIGF